MAAGLGNDFGNAAEDEEDEEMFSSWMKRPRRRNRGPEITGCLKVRTRSSALMKFHGKLCSHLCGWPDCRADLRS